MSEAASDPVSAVLEALGDPTRREIYERILTRPSRILFLAETAKVQHASTDVAARQTLRGWRLRASE